jgi:hypothetical protein
MKSRRQSSGGSSGACAAGERNAHSSGGGCKLERKDVEKNRRLHMKGLCLKLSSLIPPAAATTHASLLSDAASAAVSSNPGNKQVKRQQQPLALDSSLPPHFPRRFRAHQISSDHTFIALSGASATNWPIPNHCIHGLPRHKF